LIRGISLVLVDQRY